MNEDQVGALWVATDKDTGKPRKDKKDNTFFTGTVNGQRVVAFINKPKDNPEAPDITILKSKPAGQQEPVRRDAPDDGGIPF